MRVLCDVKSIKREKNEQNWHSNWQYTCVILKLPDTEPARQYVFERKICDKMVLGIGERLQQVQHDVVLVAVHMKMF